MPTVNLGRVGFVNKGAWNVATAYKINDVVTYGGGTYTALQAHTGQTPALGGSAFWQEWVANDNVKLSGNQTVAGVKTFTDGITGGNTGRTYINRIINGAMNINQINGTNPVTPTTGSYVSDQWYAGVTQASKLTFQQVADAPQGFKYSTKITVASQYAPLSTDIFNFQQRIEGKNIIDFKFGTAGAVTINTSLWIKGSVAGTYSCSLQNADNTRSYVGTVTIGTSWSKVSINLVGANDGAWNTDNTTGLILSIDLGSGSNFNTTAGAWQNGNFLRTAGSVTFVNQIAGSTLNITGVQLEKVPDGATQGTDYEWLHIEEEERRCEIYLPAIRASSALHIFGNGIAGSTTAVSIDYKFRVKPRVPPTGILFSSASHIQVNDTVSTTVATAISFSNASTDIAVLNITVASGLTQYRPYRGFLNNASGYILFTGAQL